MNNDTDEITIDVSNLESPDIKWDSFMDNTTIDSSIWNNSYSISTSSPSYGNITIGPINSNGGYVYTTNNTSAYPYTVGNIGIGNGGTGGTLSVKGDAEFDGDIKWKGRNLGNLLEKIEDRLAILEEPNPEKLKKFAALKKAYDNYKLLEKLIGDDVEDDDNAI
jgi:hypothetical protein